MLAGKTVKNRIVVPPMADFGMTAKDGRINARHLQHYGAYAAGGAGLIIVEACAVSPLPEPRSTIGVFDDGALPGLSQLAQAVTANGAVALVQLMHTGLSVMPETTIAQIERAKFLRIKADFIAAARRIQQAGFDGIELHAAHGYYLNQVIETSSRSDEYGGEAANRLRLLTELITEIKAACGDAFLVSVRFGNPRLDELVLTAQTICAAGGDILDVSTGSAGYADIAADFPWDGRIFAAAQVKKAVSRPVIAVGNIHSGQDAEQILTDGLADMLAIGRGHLSDPSWAQKTLTGNTPNPCRQCQRCLWFTDGRLCPAAKVLSPSIDPKQGEKPHEKSQNNRFKNDV